MQSKVRTIAACTRREPLLVVTEFMELGSLDIWLKGNREHLNPLTILRLISDVTEGLSVLHREMILHRNINPSNILLYHESSSHFQFG